MRTMNDVYTYQKQALDLLDKNNPNYEELKDLLMDQIADEIYTIYHSN